MENSTIILLLVCIFYAVKIGTPCDKCKTEDTPITNTTNTSKDTKPNNTNTPNNNDQSKCSKNFPTKPKNNTSNNNVKRKCTSNCTNDKTNKQGIPINIGSALDSVIRKKKDGGIVFKGSSTILGWGQIGFGGKKLLTVKAHFFNYNPPKNYKQMDP